MISPKPRTSWTALIVFYITMVAIVAILDSTNGLLKVNYVLAQILLLTIGVGVFALVGWRFPNLRAEYGVLLAFTVGILTIVPAILMGLGRHSDFWVPYFLVAFGMAAGSGISFLFVYLARRARRRRDQAEQKEI